MPAWKVDATIEGDLVWESSSPCVLKQSSVEAVALGNKRGVGKTARIAHAAAVCFGSCPPG